MSTSDALLGVLGALLPLSWIAFLIWSASSGSRERAKRRGVMGVGPKRDQRALREHGQAQLPPLRVHNSRSPSRNESETPGILYLVTHQKLGAAKIGISRSTSKSDRVLAHMANGWTLHSFWSLANFADAEATEGAVLNWWRNEKSLPIALKQSQMPQGGHSETVSLSHLSVREITSKVEQIVSACHGGSISASSINELIGGTYMSVKGVMRAITGIPGPGDRRRRQVTWQRLLVSDDHSQMTIELSHGRRIPLYPGTIGRQIEAVGRVEVMDNSPNNRFRRPGFDFRMTNPSIAFSERPNSTPSQRPINGEH